MTSYKLLFDNWKKNRPNYKNFCEDGILVQEKWETSNSKILFLLKETYSHFIDISGPMGPSGTSNTFWRKMKIWTYIIDELFANRDPNFNEIFIVKEQPNETVAYVNLKKNAEKFEGTNDAYSDDTDIMKYVESDKEYLIEQIKLIDPNVVFCCSTFEFAKKLYPKFQLIADNVIYANGMLFIDYFHPSNRKSYEKEFAELNHILKSALTQLENKFIFNNSYIETNNELKQIRQKKKTAISQQQFELASALNDREKDLTKKVKELKKI